MPPLCCPSLIRIPIGMMTGIYDVDYFIKSLRYDVHVVESIPEIRKHGRTKKIKSFQLRPPRDAPISWYTTVALEKMKEHGAIYLTPFSHRLAEENDNSEYQRLRCRVNYHALRIKPHIVLLSQSIVANLRSQGHFMSIHLRFEKDMLSFAGDQSVKCRDQSVLMQGPNCKMQGPKWKMENKSPSSSRREFFHAGVLIYLPHMNKRY
ncbi:putative GDP-fucose protein O-fucosyltransferase [Helianthus annuus]|nr:putative GDP-fucose protein O-fucosyltransferase [Helianthus annuus]